MLSKISTIIIEKEICDQCKRSKKEGAVLCSQSEQSGSQIDICEDCVGAGYYICDFCGKIHHVSRDLEKDPCEGYKKELKFREMVKEEYNNL